MDPCGVCGSTEYAMFIGECTHDLLCGHCLTWAKSYFAKLVIWHADHRGTAREALRMIFSGTASDSTQCYGTFTTAGGTGTSSNVGFSFADNARIEVDEEQGLTLPEARRRCASGWIQYAVMPLAAIHCAIRKFVRIRDKVGQRGIGCLNFRRAV